MLLRLRDDLEDRFQSVSGKGANGNHWKALLAKWDQTLANALQLSPQKGTLAQDLDVELERLYDDHVGLQRAPGRVGAPVNRAQMRSYRQQVFRHAGLWERIAKRAQVSQLTFPGDP